MLTDLIVSLMASNPSFTAFLTIMGLLRAVNKPVFATIQAIVDSTDTKSDDKWWAKMQRHKAMKSLFWVLDWTASVKVPKGK